MTDLITQYSYGPLLPVTLLIILIGMLAYKIIFSFEIFSSLSNQPISGPFVALPAIAFFFMVGFISLHQFSRQEDSKQTLAIEVSSIENMLNVPDANNFKQQEIRSLLKNYLDVSLNEEWAGTLNRIPSPEINKIIKKILNKVIGYTCAGKIQMFQHGKWCMLTQGRVETESPFEREQCIFSQN
jgi:hypothetical protein